ncbi:MAG: hypothetical protein ACYDEX_05720 [Mobilitalea sp.]
MKLEDKFHNDMIHIYKTAKNELGYNASRFIQLVSEKGGVQAAKQLIMKEGGTDGFTTLWQYHRLDLSVEAHVIRDEYRGLFTDEERLICQKRLDEFKNKTS